MSSGDNKVYVGNLGDNTSKKELEDVFFKYGPITNIWVARNPPGFAFVEFEDHRDAKDAIRALDGTKCCGTRLIVEPSNGGRGGRGSTARRRSSPPVRRSRSPWRKGSLSCSRSRSRSLPKRSRSLSRSGSERKGSVDGGGGRKYREWELSCKVYVGNLLNNASKNELEDVFSKYGPVKNVWVARNPPGFAFVEFDDARDAEDAVRALDGMRVCGTRIIVEMSNGKTRRSRRRSPYTRRSRSRSPWKRNSRGRSRSPRSRSRSRSPASRRDRSRSLSRDRR